MSDIRVSIVNQCSVLQDSDVKPVVDALQIQVTRDFAPAWGIDAELIFVPKGQTPDANTWMLLLLDNSDTQGALGYHDLNPVGMPMGKVFAKTDLDCQSSWSITLSHELLELLADPDINLTTFVQTSPQSGYLFAFEMCDAVEDDQFGYEINGVQVSNFVLPAYFQRSIKTDKWDFCGHLPGPVPAMLEGGYLSQFPVNVPGQSGGWSQINASQLAEGRAVANRAARVLPSSRRKIRACKVTGL